MSQYFDAYTDAHSYLPEQACLTWIRTDDLEQVIHALGADPAEASEETWTDLIDEDSGEDVLAARYGSWTLLMEPFTCHGMNEPVLSAGQEVYGLRWTVNHDVVVSYARAGEIVSAFDPLDLEGAERAWANRVSEDEWRRDWLAAALAQGEELSGLRLDRAWLARPHLAFTPAPVQRRPPLRLDADMRAAVAGDARLAAIVADPAEDILPEVIAYAAELVVATTGLDDPLVEEALRLIAEREWNSERARAAGRELHTLSRSLQEQARAVFDGTGGMHPGHDTEHGRLLLQDKAAQTLMCPLGTSRPLPTVARETARLAGLTHLDEDDDERQRVLYAVAYYVDMDDNWL
ncbi:hypothetical protein ACTWPT_54425 [Nonomuraea sp. 3N208]|uniref:hypothetical protein n=1 Tax=Nonomuraea sp. 3N208 TaxID=3457421 RepID=UPI003FD51FC6